MNKHKLLKLIIPLVFVHTEEVKSLFIQKLFRIRYYYIVKIIHNAQHMIENRKHVYTEKVRSLFIQKVVRIRYAVKITQYVQNIIKNEILC